MNLPYFLTLIFFCCFCTTSIAQGGFLDPTFGEDGVVITDASPTHDHVIEILQRPDGKLLVIGQRKSGADDIILAQYKLNGMLDESFGNNGIILSNIPDFGHEVFCGALQDDGKIVVGGLTPEGVIEFFNPFLARYNANGSLDTTFGTNGFTYLDIDGITRFRDVALQADGKIVATGERRLFRFNSDGLLDTTFGNNGKVLLTFDAYTINLLPDEKIVVTGTGNGRVFVARIRPTGNYDLGFGAGSGIAITELDGLEAITNDAVLQADGKIVITCRTQIVSNVGTDFILLRYQPNGTLDEEFGENGIVITDINYFDSPISVRLQKDGKIIVAGHTRIFEFLACENFALTRYLPYGTLDPDFGIGGIVITDIEDQICEYVNDALIQNDNKILVGGRSYDGSPYNKMALLRYHHGCVNCYEEVEVEACDVYISPGGKLWNESGIYLDTIPTFEGCDSILTINLTIHENPQVTFIQEGISLTANVDEEAEFQWLNCDMNFITIPGATTPVYVADTPANYAVEISTTHCVDTSECQWLELCGQYQMPNAFTPDADQVNDTFWPVSLGTIEVRDFRIYNRWGELVHNSVLPWNGTYNNKPAISDAYVYFITIQTICEETQLRGSVVLIR